MSLDPRKFVEHFRAHHDFVWRSLRSLGVPESSADNALQEVFIVMHRKLPELDPQMALRGWLYGVARNIARADRRRTARTVELKTLPDRTSDLPEAACQRQQATAAVAQFLSSLDEDKKAVFIMSEIEGMTAPEISRTLGIKLNTVYSRIRIARNRFSEATRRLRIQQQGEQDRFLRQEHG